MRTILVSLLVLLAATQAVAEEGGAVQLLSEPCRLTDAIKNLPLRATWTEGGKVTEGCWGRHPEAPGVIVTYWEDKTIVPILMERLRPTVRPKVDT